MRDARKFKARASQKSANFNLTHYRNFTCLQSWYNLGTGSDVKEGPIPHIEFVDAVAVFRKLEDINFRILAALKTMANQKIEALKSVKKIGNRT